MNFLKSLFSKEKSPIPNIVFGRNYEIIKSDEQLEHWDLAMSSFEAERYLDSIEHFLLYLIDSKVNLVEYTRNQEGIQFSVIQGSKKILAHATNEWFRASVDIVVQKELTLGLCRRMLESSYKLFYSRYALTENSIIQILFDGNLQEASPNKLLYGLKEMALRADKDDDLILDEFSQLESINSSHIIPIDEQERKVKFQFFKKWTNDAIDIEQYGALKKSKFPGARIYVLLSTLYKIDYLIRPEGRLMETIDTSHRNYFAKDDNDLYTKLSELEKSFNTVFSIDEYKLSKELYLVFHTFPLTNLITTEELSQFIEVEIQAMQWYYENEHFNICEAICDYIIGSNLYNYTIPTVSHQLMHAYYELTATDYFKSLGFDLKYNLEKNLEKSADEFEEKCRNIIISNLGDDKKYEQILKFDSSSKVNLLMSFLEFLKNFHY